MPRKPPSKAANGRGSLYWNNNRERWEMKVTVGRRPNGSLMRRVVTGRTQQECMEKLPALQKVVEISPDLSPDPTVGQYLTHWLDAVITYADVSQGTRDNYAQVVKSYIVPTIGHIRLSQLAPKDVRWMISSLSKEGKSTNTQRLARAVLRRALRSAEIDELVTRNVAALTDGIRLDFRERETLTVAQAKQLLTFIQGHDLEAVVMVMLSLGLRRGEVAGLTWDDLTLPDDPSQVGAMRVVRAVKPAADGTLYVDATKTTRTRILPMSPQLVDALKRYRTRQAEVRLAYGPGWGAMFPQYRWVFTNSVGSPLDPNKLTRNLKRLTSEAGIGEWSPHDLRHSAATILFAQGASPKVVQEVLGHSSVRVSMDIYTHMQKEMMQEASRVMTSALWGDA